MICAACHGEGTLHDQGCGCTWITDDKQPNPGCQRCHGSGKVNQSCWHCAGHGQFFDTYDLVFRNEVGETAAVHVDLRPSASLPLQMRERINNSFPELRERYWRTDLWRIIGPALQELGFASLHEAVVVGGSSGRVYTDAIMVLGDAGAGSNRAGYDPDPDEEEMQFAAKSELMRRFTASFGSTSTDAPKEVRLVRKPPINDLLDDVRSDCEARGDDTGFSIVVCEGNIATGEAGWQVCMTRSGNPVREIAIAYGLTEALMNAHQFLRIAPP